MSIIKSSNSIFANNNFTGHITDTLGTVWNVTTILALEAAVKMVNELEPHNFVNIHDYADDYGPNHKTAIAYCVSVSDKDDEIGVGFYTIFVEAQYDAENNLFVRQ